MLKCGCEGVPILNNNILYSNSFAFIKHIACTFIV